MCWLAANDSEHAASALASGGDVVASGELFLDLAKLQLARSQWVKARDSAAAAFAKGGLRSPGEAHLVLGVAHYYTKRKDAALAALSEAKKAPATAKCAEAWLQVAKSGKGAAPACLQVGGGAAASTQ